MADEARSLKAYGELPDNSAFFTQLQHHCSFLHLFSAVAPPDTSSYTVVPSMHDCSSIGLLAPAHVYLSNSHAVHVDETDAFGEDENNNNSSYLCHACSDASSLNTAVRVNETDAFGEDEDRDEYFDFEDVSEI